MWLEYFNYRRPPTTRDKIEAAIAKLLLAVVIFIFGAGLYTVGKFLF